MASKFKNQQKKLTSDISFELEQAALKLINNLDKINLAHINLLNIAFKSITNLDIGQNHIGTAGAKALAEKLRQQQQAEADEKARQEAERLEQEAAKLKVIEEAKVKEYVPEIQVVKLFKVADGDNQFDNDDQATIKQVSNLIRDGNDRLQEHGKKGILLLGNTGAGKSTLAYVLTGRELQAIIDDETSELVIDAMQPLADIVIGHKLSSETKIPNKCFAKDKDLIIWDCPGFNDTDPVQEIANSFYIKRLFETTEQLKFVLVIPELVLNSAVERGSAFLATLSNFIKSFKDIGYIEGSISLVVTHVPPNKNIQHIKKSIDKILADNQGATDEHKALINKLKDNGSIYLFYKPTDEGELVVPDLLVAIDMSSKYSNAKGDMVNIAISKKAMECSSHLLNTASNNFNQLLEVIVKAIGNATKCSDVNPLNAFSENYNLVKDWIPSSIHYNNLLPGHNKDEYFLELELLSRLQKVFSKPIDSISNALINFQIAVEIFAEYAEPNNIQLQHQIQGYGYCLQQQYEYVKFFASVCKKAAELPDHAKIAELIIACHTKVTENLEYQVSSLNIDEDRLDQVYYHKAIKYLEDYQDSPACKNLKAIAYSCLATISEKDGENGALAYYVKAIEANSHLPKIYEKLGQLFFNKGEYAKAIDCYKVVNNEFSIEECFKAWLKQDKRNPDIKLKQAEYFESVGLFEKAKKCYHHAFSLSHDENFKAAAYKKISKIMDNVAAQGQNFATRADEHDFYNYDLVNEEFTNNLLGDLKCDLYC
ncbi:leucine-rich repeat domain-containing protein [Candidatus Tisiphia endosymbiont of Dascillus cervinus]|uniref:leucine-rich repeat domain-containing protein n=1 Tax=Candidatus Tisiphia endosymbiont of Dascillus cervinus TaxID=3066253 RepID=UPI00312C965C